MKQSHIFASESKLGANDWFLSINILVFKMLVSKERQYLNQQVDL